MMVTTIGDNQLPMTVQWWDSHLQATSAITYELHMESAKWCVMVMSIELGMVLTLIMQIRYMYTVNNSYDGGISIMSELRTNRIIPRDGLASGI